MQKTALVRFLEPALNVVDLFFSPLTLVSGIWLRFVRRAGLQRMSLSRKILDVVGILPVRKHYYEPYAIDKDIVSALGMRRSIPMLNLEVERQLALISSFSFADELSILPNNSKGDLSFFVENGNFEAGDAEFYYSFVRKMKPKRIIEIGAGHSTRIAVLAASRNEQEDSRHSVQITCVEPFEMPWLEKIGVNVIRKRVEEMDLGFFKQLNAGDILFIDSSHVLRPQGDVLFEILEILPALQSGVYIHFHDVFTPRDYPAQWVCRERRLWGEQYLLEAFLCSNNSFRVVCALNDLKNEHFKIVAEYFPHLACRPQCQPGSFWIQKVDASLQ